MPFGHWGLWTPPNALSRHLGIRALLLMLYRGEPGSEYGVLTPVASASSLEQTRPSAFASSTGRRSTIPTGPDSNVPKTFQDILPPDLITTSTMSNTSGQTASPSAGGNFVNLVRKSTLRPKMQGVVHSLRRSVTSMRRPRLPSSNAPNPESEGKSGSIFRRLSKLSTSNTIPSNPTSSSSICSKDSDSSRHSVMPVHPLSHS
uniref:Uncharacterized protein n=1 Tax=Psilocybe cubensis TaxID=181762 RepID=A0A8H7XQY2_PSICU